MGCPLGLCLQSVVAAQGVGMEQQSPLCVLERLGGAGQDEIARFPSVLLNMVRTEMVHYRDSEDGNDLLAHYPFRRAVLCGVRDSAAGGSRGR